MDCKISWSPEMSGWPNNAKPQRSPQIPLTSGFHQKCLVNMCLQLKSLQPQRRPHSHTKAILSKRLQFLKSMLCVGLKWPLNTFEQTCSWCLHQLHVHPYYFDNKIKKIYAGTIIDRDAPIKDRIYCDSERFQCFFCLTWLFYLKFAVYILKA